MRLSEQAGGAVVEAVGSFSAPLLAAAVDLSFAGGLSISLAFVVLYRLAFVVLYRFSCCCRQQLYAVGGFIDSLAVVGSSCMLSAATTACGLWLL